MIDISRARFAYGSTVSVAWIPTEDDTAVRYAYAVRSKNDKHDKRLVRELLVHRLATTSDARFTFHAKRAYEKTIDREFLGFRSTLLSILAATMDETFIQKGLYAEELRGFVREMVKPSMPVNGAPRHVFRTVLANVKQVTILEQVRAEQRNQLAVRLPVRPVAKYTKEGEPVTFYHDRENGFSIGYAQRGNMIWFGLAVLSENDQFDKNKAREVILNSAGVKFGIDPQGAVLPNPMPHHHVMHYISTCIGVYLRGQIDNMPEIRDLKRFRKNVLTDIGFNISRKYNPIAQALRGL